MKKRLTLGVIATALAATASFVAAGPRGDVPVAVAQVLPHEEIVATVESLGLVPTTRVLRRGPYYVLHALDHRGVELRIVADAALGDILSLTPVYIPRYDGGPRIIHVPQPAERARRDYESDAAITPGEEFEERAVPLPDRAANPPLPDGTIGPPLPERTISPPLPDRAVGTPQAERDVVAPAERAVAPARERSVAPARQPRSVRSVPPPPALTPIYPTPRFGERKGASRERQQPDAQQAAKERAAKEIAERAAEKYRALSEEVERRRRQPAHPALPPAGNAR